MLSSAPGQSTLGGGAEDPHKPPTQFDALNYHDTDFRSINLMLRRYEKEKRLREERSQSSRPFQSISSNAAMPLPVSHCSMISEHNVKMDLDNEEPGMNSSLDKSRILQFYNEY